MKNLVLPDIHLNKEVNKCSSMEYLVGKNGLMQRLFGNIIQQFLEAEMEDQNTQEVLMKIKIIEMDLVLKILKLVLVRLKSEFQGTERQNLNLV